MKKVWAAVTAPAAYVTATAALLWHYYPANVQAILKAAPYVAVGIGFIVATIFTAVTVHYRFIDPSHFEAWRLSQLPDPQTRHVKNNEEDGYKTLAIVPMPVVRVAASEPKEAPQQERKMVIQVKAKPPLVDGTRAQSVAVETPDGSAKYDVITMYDSQSWAIGSQDKFQQPDKTTVAVETALENSNVSELSASAKRIICFGLSSSEPSDDPQKNEKLSDWRAVNLCRALVRLKYAHPDDKKILGVAMGVADAVEGGTYSVVRQRAAIIVGEQQGYLEFGVAEYVQSLIEVTKVDGVRLDRYSRYAGQNWKILEMRDYSNGKSDWTIYSNSGDADLSDEFDG